jgi:hypothetical protein
MDKNEVKGILGFVYGIAKGYMMAQAMKTGNAQFVAQLNTAFTSVEAAWKAINDVGAPVPPTPPTTPTTPAAK